VKISILSLIQAYLCRGICSLLSFFFRKNKTKKSGGGALLLVAECWEQCLWPCLASRAALSPPLASREGFCLAGGCLFPQQGCLCLMPIPTLIPRLGFCLRYLLTVVLPPGSSSELYRSSPTVLGHKNYAWLPCWYYIWVLFWEIGKIWIFSILHFCLLLILCSVFFSCMLFFNPVVSSYILSSSPKSVFQFRFPLIQVYFFFPWTRSTLRAGDHFGSVSWA